MQSVNDQQLRQVSDLFITELKGMEGSTDWESKSDKQVAVFEKKIENRMIAKAVTLVKLPFDIVLRFFSYPSYITLLDKEHVEKFEVLYDNKELRVVHMIMKLPMPLSDREVTAVNTVKVEETKAYIGNKSCDYPNEKQKKTEVALVNISGFILEKVSEGQTLLTYISDVDLQGHIPDLIKNFIVCKLVEALSKVEQIIKDNPK